MKMEQKLKNKHIIIAPHLDDEIIGCYSILDKIDLIIYHTKDYRETAIKDNPKYIHFGTFLYNYTLHKSCTIYLPSKYDYHPRHNYLTQVYKKYKCKKMYYSVEMNVPWLEEEEDPGSKQALFDKLYPDEDMKSDKYFLFKSIKPYDDIIYKILIHHLYNGQLLYIHVPTFLKETITIQLLKIKSNNMKRVMEKYQYKYGLNIKFELR